MTLGPLRFEVLGVSYQPQGPFRHPTLERRGSGRQVEPGGPQARAVFWVRQGVRLSAPAVEDPGPLRRHPRRMSLDIFKCQEIAAGN